jgi:integrase
MTKGEANRGAVRRVKGPNGQVLFQAFLPRRYSTPPRDCASPESYQEPLGPRFDTEREARQLLNAALVDLREKKTLQHGLPLSHYVSEAIDAEHHAARRKYDDEARANTRTSTWRSIEKLWLRNEDFMSWPPRDVSVVRLRQWLNFMNDKALGQKGKPLSAHFVRNCVRLLSKAFDRVPDLPNPITALDVPEKPAPSIIHLTFAEQRRLFRAPESDVPLEQRIMIGCGMGSGLRVGELLAIEPQHVHLDDDDDLHLWVEYGGPNHAPTKSGQSRRVELFEPGLGFWRLWMAKHFQKGNRLVFQGPRGGFQKHWPEAFAGWSDAVGVRSMTSHIMRHSYAVSLLCGWWGYEPRSMQFISQQLGHADLQTTERYYAKFDTEVFRREANRMRGRESSERRGPVTAQYLLTSVREDVSER